ncbi:unnamed protein product [Closterium sp. Yama58-4]|nr:unnamed protein product [Closterium sp. Yama58-4]
MASHNTLPAKAIILSSRLPVYTDDDDDAAFEAWLREQEREETGGGSGKGGKTAKTGKLDAKSSEKRGGGKGKERRSETGKEDPSASARAAAGGKRDGAVAAAGKGEEAGGSGSAGKDGGKTGRGGKEAMEGVEVGEEQGGDEEAAKVAADVSVEEAEGDADVSGEEAEVAAEVDDDVCEVCGGDGELLMCDACPAVYHLHCLHPPLSRVPEGAWFCPKCGHDWSAAERFLGVREVEQRGEDKSHIHCTWVAAATVDAAAKSLPGLKARMRYYLRQRAEAAAQSALYGDGEEDPEESGAVPVLRPDWLVVERIVNAKKNRKGQQEYLVKWRELGYEEATWETEEDMRSKGRGPASGTEQVPQEGLNDGAKDGAKDGKKAADEGKKGSGGDGKGKKGMKKGGWEESGAAVVEGFEEAVKEYEEMMARGPKASTRKLSFESTHKLSFESTHKLSSKSTRKLSSGST